LARLRGASKSAPPPESSETTPASKIAEPSMRIVSSMVSGYRLDHSVRLWELTVAQRAKLEGPPIKSE